MMKRRRLESSESNLRERVIKLAELVWHQNQSRMARDLGLDQASISRLVGRSQQPSAQVLEALANWPGVNVVWLFTGLGDPLGSVAASGGRYRPITDQLLSGPPDDHREMLSGYGGPVAEAFFSTTNYWFRVPAGSGLGRCSICAGDLLLMETDPKSTRDWGVVLGKLCGIRMARRDPARLILAHIRDSAESNPFEDAFQIFPMEVYGRGGSSPFAPGTARFLVPGPRGELPSHRRRKGARFFVVEDIASVCLRLERSFSKRGGT
jgi:hypothetical protein